MADKKISELPLVSSINSGDISLLISDGTDYKFAFSNLLQFIGDNLTIGAKVSFGTALPPNSTGKNGDIFVKTDTGAFVQKVSGTWTVVYTIPSSSGTTNGAILYGVGLPGNITGVDNDTYINTGTGIFYKKLSGSWSQVFSMQTGPQGPQGTAGASGTNGSNGFSLLNGVTTPSNLGTGVNGDFYINTATYTLYGPKIGGVWGTGTSLIGSAIPTGGATGQVLMKNSNDSMDVDWVDVSFENIAGTPTDNASLSAALNAKADLVSGKIPSGQLPSYVDDVVEFANFANLPGTGETGKIYVTLDDNCEYRWSGSTYIQLVASPESTDAVAEGSVNKYLTASRVLSTVLSGVSFVANAAVIATDTILAAVGKLQGQINGLSSIFQAKENQSLSTANNVTFSNVEATGILNAGRANVGSGLPSGFHGNADGRFLIAWNRSNSEGETVFANNGGVSPYAVGGYSFLHVDNSGVETEMFKLSGNDFAAFFAGRVLPGIIDASTTPATKYLTYNPTTRALESRTVAEVASDIGAGGSNDFGTLFYSSIISWDFSVKKNQSLVLYGDAVVQINNMNDGDVALLVVKQDSIGSRNISILGDCRIAGSTTGELELSTEVDKEDSLYIFKKGSVFYVQVYKAYIGTPIDMSPTYLDSYAANIKAAFSTSKLFSSSTNCVRLRRDSDDTEQDFGFVDGIIDTESIITFVGAGNAYLVKWYDQSVNAAHYEQHTAVNQPKLKLNSLNGLPSLEFNGSTSFMTSGSFIDSSFNQNSTFFTLGKKYSSGFFLHECASDPSKWYAARNSGSVFNGVGGVTCVAFNNDDTKLYLDTYKYDGVKAYAYVNNTLYNSVAKTGDIGFSGAMTMGRLTGSSFWWNGEIHTKIYFNTALSETNLKIVGEKIGRDYGLLKMPHITFDGNSLTYGINSSSGNNSYPGASYPSQLVQALGGTSGFTFTNQGQGGATTEEIDTNLSGSNVYNTNGFCSKLIDVFWEGRNSIALGDTAVQAFNAMVIYLTKYRALGFKRIAVLTCQPTMINSADANATNLYGVSTNSFETQRLLYNQLIRDNVNTVYDYVVDIAADDRVGSLVNITDTMYWDSLGVHMTDAGYLAVAQMVTDTINTILND